MATGDDNVLGGSWSKCNGKSDDWQTLIAGARVGVGYE